MNPSGAHLCRSEDFESNTQSSIIMAAICWQMLWQTGRKSTSPMCEFLRDSRLQKVINDCRIVFGKKKTMMQLYHRPHCCWFFLFSFEGAVVDGFWLLNLSRFVDFYLCLLSPMDLKEFWNITSSSLAFQSGRAALRWRADTFTFAWPFMNVCSSSRMHPFSWGSSGFLIDLPRRLVQVLSGVTPKPLAGFSNDKSVGGVPPSLLPFTAVVNRLGWHFNILYYQPLFDFFPDSWLDRSN